MGDLLSVLAIIGLLALVVVSVMKQRAGMTQARADENARHAGDDDQRQRSLRRRAEARAAPHHDG